MEKKKETRSTPVKIIVDCDNNEYVAVFVGKIFDKKRIPFLGKKLIALEHLITISSRFLVA